MEGKLIKTDKGNYVLVDPTKSVYDEGYMLGSSRECDVAKLSLKNCQAIERGYDLYKLAEEEYLKHENNELLYGDSEDKQLAYKAGIVDGFQKALELMGDKKFSGDDMKRAFEVGEDFGSLPFSSYSTSKRLNKKEFIQSLQQNEWDVEIEMICPHPEDTYVCGIQYGCDEDGCNHPNKIPLLDADGYLILKQKL